MPSASFFRIQPFPDRYSNAQAAPGERPYDEVPGQTNVPTSTANHDPQQVHTQV